MQRDSQQVAAHVLSPGLKSAPLRMTSSPLTTWMTHINLHLEVLTVQCAVDHSGLNSITAGRIGTLLLALLTKIQECFLALHLYDVCTVLPRVIELQTMRFYSIADEHHRYCVYSDPAER